MRGYDRLSRLTGVTPPTGSPTTYTYDPVGNRLTKTRGTTTSYSHDKADRLTTAGGVTSTFDANGNLTGRGSRTFAYDQANRLITTTLGTNTTRYTYDGDGNRTQDTYCDCDPVASTLDVNTGLPVLLDDGDRRYVWGNGLAYAVTGSGLVLTYHADGLGSVRALSDASGAITQTYQTDEFGIPTLVSGPSAQPFRYTGEPWDVETGLLYLRARYYDPYTGRFISRDPFARSLGAPQSLNRYTYVANNPVAYTDPTGHCAPPATPVCAVGVATAPAWVPLVEGGLTVLTGLAVLGATQAAKAIDLAQLRNDAYYNLKAFLRALGLAPAPVQRELPNQVQSSQTGKSDFISSPSGATVRTATADRWHLGTFNNVVESMAYHLAKHGKGRTIEAYTDDAMAFFEANRSQATSVILKDGSRGLRIQTGSGAQKVGGYWTEAGRLVTFWD